MSYTFRQYNRDIWRGLCSGDPLTWLYYIGCIGGELVLLAVQIWAIVHFSGAAQ